MSTETATTETKPAFSVENIHISDADLPAFTDMPFEDIEELHLDHPGSERRRISGASGTTSRVFRRSFARRV